MKNKILVLLLIGLISCNKEDSNKENGIGATLNGNCWCTDYVAHEVGILSYPDAWQWSSSTLGDDYIKVELPQAGDIIVMNKYYNGTGVYGHVGIVKQVTNSKNNFTILIHGANQPGTKFDECNCDNVTDWTRNVSNSDISEGKVTFYRETPNNFSCFMIQNEIDPPVLLSPINNNQVEVVELQWQQVPNAKGYLLEIDGIPVNIDSGITTVYCPTLNYGSHNWRACTKSINNTYSNWSDIETFIYIQNSIDETCNGIDDDSDGIIDNQSSCWQAIYRFIDPTTGARCWNNSTSPPTGLENYQYEIEAWVSSTNPIPNTFELVQCSKLTDNILLERNSEDYNSLINAGYKETASLGFVWYNGGVAHENKYLNNSYKVCKVYRFSYMTNNGNSAHLFTRGADDLTNMQCEMPPRFEVITTNQIFASPPCY